MANSLLNTTGIQNTLNGLAPCEGPRCIPLQMDFSTGNVFVTDLTAQTQGGQFTFLQTVYVDNSANGSTLTMTMNGSVQSIVVPANACGYFTVLATSPAKMTFATAGLVTVYAALLNFYIPPTVWSAI